MSSDTDSKEVLGIAGVGDVVVLRDELLKLVGEGLASKKEDIVNIDGNDKGVCNPSNLSVEDERVRIGLSTLISCLSRQYSGLYLSPTLPTLLPASDIPDRCTIRGLLHDYRNPPPTDYFRIFPTIRSILWP